MTNNIVIHWFQKDLRLADNPAFWTASKHRNVLPIYIMDEVSAGEYPMGSASRWWLHYSLKSLKVSLHGALSIYRGNTIDILTDLTKRYGVGIVCWNRCYEPWQTNLYTKVNNALLKLGVECQIFNGTLLWEPWQIKKEDGKPYKVFTPFFQNGCLKAKLPRRPLSVPTDVEFYFDSKNSVSIKSLELLPTRGWDSKFHQHWEPGEKAAKARFAKFLDTGLPNYKDGRNLPAEGFVSRLSPHVHFGEISPNQLWYSTRKKAIDRNVEHFCSELGWREFSYNQLYYNPSLPIKNLQSKFDKFPWQKSSEVLQAWQSGLTGVPMVDAGMRELWQTGYMHNRVRMIVGSFLVKNLRLHWIHGARWFWDTLVDADLANNNAGWQWIAGCGYDAAPYFRIFNPVLQGKKFDKSGLYIRKYIPEIAALPEKYLFNPWTAPDGILQAANIELGSTYPRPIVDLQISRNAALNAYKAIQISES